MKTLSLAAAVVLACLPTPAMARADDAPLARLDFLLGDWTASGGGTPGQIRGEFSFRPALEGRVLVRTARSEVAGAPDRKPTVHEDLVVVHGDAARADYFDSEGHVIHYALTIDSAAHVVVFRSDDPGPAFRLTYRELLPGRLRVTFEISPTGREEDFKPYLDGEALRKKPPGS
jgi:hypothetical protein